MEANWRRPNETTFAGSRVALLDLSAPAIETVRGMLQSLTENSAGDGDADSVERAGDLGADLPTEISIALERLTGAGHEPALVIRGIEVDDLAIGPTPSHWTACHPFAARSPTRREESLLALIAQSIGEIFGYATPQDGRIVHNVMPISGAESDQSGHGSEATLAWHTEDAFTHVRADYLALLGLRNAGAVATTVAGIGALDELDPFDWRLLSEARFAIVPDDEHLRASIRPGMSVLTESRDGGLRMPVLSRGHHGFQMMIDSVYMRPVDETAAAAFRRAAEALDAQLRRIRLGPGDILLIDNHRAVHGRERFPARFDGTDRWLLKASIARSLEPSAAYRTDPASRILQ
jgi:Fe(II)/alpha-ketoglutarate-dependent arginine beta-hydroxylase